jgi:hypothetical protein
VCNKLLGTGAFGNVYDCGDKVLKMVDNVKYLENEFRFIYYMQNMQKNNHKFDNIVKMYPVYKIINNESKHMRKRLLMDKVHEIKESPIYKLYEVSTNIMNMKKYFINKSDKLGDLFDELQIKKQMKINLLNKLKIYDISNIVTHLNNSQNKSNIFNYLLKYNICQYNKYINHLKEKDNKLSIYLINNDYKLNENFFNNNFEIVKLKIIKLFTNIINAVLNLHNILKYSHNDIKPDNIGIEINSIDVIKLIDFGFSENVDENKHDYDEIEGTFQYMNRNKLIDSKRDEYNNDLWAVGCTIYELACFSKFFNVNHPYQMMNLLPNFKREHLEYILYDKKFNINNEFDEDLLKEMKDNFKKCLFHKEIATLIYLQMSLSFNTDKNTFKGGFKKINNYLNKFNTEIDNKLLKLYENNKLSKIDRINIENINKNMDDQYGLYSMGDYMKEDEKLSKVKKSKKIIENNGDKYEVSDYRQNDESIHIKMKKIT